MPARGNREGVAPAEIVSEIPTPLRVAPRQVVYGRCSCAGSRVGVWCAASLGPSTDWELFVSPTLTLSRAAVALCGLSPTEFHGLELT
jgi:hypothetical protein